MEIGDEESGFEDQIPDILRRTRDSIAWRKEKKPNMMEGNGKVKITMLENDDSDESDESYEATYINKYSDEMDSSEEEILQKEPSKDKHWVPRGTFIHTDNVLTRQSQFPQSVMLDRSPQPATNNAAVIKPNIPMMLPQQFDKPQASGLAYPVKSRGDRGKRNLWLAEIKKPIIMKVNDNWRQFLSSFMNYAELTEIQQEKIISVMITYLHPHLAEKVLILKLSKDQMKNPEEALKLINPVMEGPKSKITSCIMLTQLKQDNDMSITTFAENIRIQASQCDLSSEEAWNQACLYTFISGLYDDEVSVEILKERPSIENFDDAVKIAVNVALAKESRRKMKKKGDIDSIPVFAIAGDSSNPTESWTARMLEEKDQKIKELEYMLSNMQAEDYHLYRTCEETQYVYNDNALSNEGSRYTY